MESGDVGHNFERSEFNDDRPKPSLTFFGSGISEEKIKMWKLTTYIDYMSLKAFYICGIMSIM